MKIAVIGSGVSGLIAAWLLDKYHEVTVFEKEPWIGGHTHTVAVEEHDQTHWLDTGFIVCNQENYPNFFKILNHFKLPLNKTEMSFSVQAPQQRLIYNGTSLNGIFSQRKNLFSPKFWRMLAGILKFNKRAKQMISEEKVALSLNDFCKEVDIQQDAYQYYLIPMLAAIWSTDRESIKKIPAWFVCKFLDNHGLLDITNRPQWYTLQGGSHQYVKCITQELSQTIHTNTAVRSVQRNDSHVVVQTDEAEHQFDQVIFATHSDQALALLKSPTKLEQQILGGIGYQNNDVILHTDRSVLPPMKRAWASWNYLLSDVDKMKLSVSYYMNMLQGLSAKKHYCVSLNQRSIINPNSIIADYQYSHPIFDVQAQQCQQQILKINGQNRSYFCGAYCGYGFHEDGVSSALTVIKLIDKDILCRAPFTKA